MAETAAAVGANHNRLLELLGRQGHCFETTQVGEAAKEILTPRRLRVEPLMCCSRMVAA